MATNNDKFLLDLFARTVAQDMLLRTLWEGVARSQPDPQGFLTTEIESLIGSLDAMAVKNWGLQAAPKAEAAIREGVEQELRFFLNQMLLRVER